MNPDFETILQKLLENPSFVTWARGENEDEDLFWQHWAGGSAEKIEILNKAKELVLAFDGNPYRVSDSHIDAKIQQALQTAQAIEGKPKNWWRSIHFNAWQAAATVAIVLGLGYAAVNYQAKHRMANREGVQLADADNKQISIVRNTDRAFRYVQLPDGSSVVLHKNSSVSFDKNFDKKREVHLSGEAFFEVTKDPENPFFVYTNELVAKVHGTSFSIKSAEDDDHITVAVKTGKVSLFAKSDSRAEEYKQKKELTALLLTCNEQAIFEKNLAKLTRLQSKSPVLLNIPIEEQIFTYSETPVATVFDALEKAYGIEIEYNKDQMSQCSVTATLGDEPLDNKLRWITTILEAEYTIDGEKVTIKGNPCN